MTSAVRVEVNEANLVKNLKFAFSNFSTFLVELIQNSRRAGATRVEISLDGKDLTVVDDGHGIENFQNLFTIAESGWNHQTRSIENPFGMGFTSALFACERLTVESRGQRLEATTRALLDMVEVPVVTGEITTGTRPTLSKLSFDETRMEGALQSIARGYPIPIIFNGVALARPEALDATTFDQTPIGAVWIKDLSHVTLGSSDVCVFLQGILVAGSSHCRAPHVVVHLDSAKFKAKLPDRNCLIDAEEKLAEINQHIGHLIHRRLADLQKTMATLDFASTYWNVACKYATDVLRDHPVVPADVFSEIEALLCYSDGHDPRVYVSARDAKPLFREAFDRGERKVVIGSCYVDLESDPACALKLAYVKSIGAAVVSSSLPAGHWLLNAPELDDFDVLHELVNPGSIAGSDIFSWEFDLRICDAIRISGIWGVVVIDDEEIAVCADGDVRHLTVYSPQAVNRPGAGVKQFEDFYCDDRFDESWHDECLDKYRRWIKQARHCTPTDLLNDLLSDIYVDTSSALGTRYILEVSDHGHLNVVEKLESVPA